METPPPNHVGDDLEVALDFGQRRISVGPENEGARLARGGVAGVRRRASSRRQIRSAATRRRAQILRVGLGGAQLGLRSVYRIVARQWPPVYKKSGMQPTT